MSRPTAPVYGSNNARNTKPEDVAKGFVAPPQFWEIVPAENTALRGPRGSGKTTLLKMLQVPALEAWEDDEADRAREMATYSGVFVPADRSWTGQVEAHGRDLGVDTLRTSLGNACFVLHALRALVRCAEERVRPTDAAHPHGRAKVSPEVQESIVRDVWREWALTEPVSSLTGLRFALSDLIADLGRTAREALRTPGGVDRLTNHRALNLDVIDATVPFIERFNHAADQEDHVWAFLIDEIEFLPPGIYSGIIRSMRGRDTRIIQKVSMAPYTSVTSEFDDPLGGMAKHDVTPVDLTFDDKEAGYPFSRRLVERALPDDLTPQGLLGDPGWFERPAGQDAYGDGTRNGAAIRSLAGKDKDFRRWLEEHQIDAEHLDETQGDERAATLRKAIQVILLRDEYLRASGGRLVHRSRKAAKTYVGEYSTYALCENNPRLLKGLIVRLVSAAKRGQLSDSVRAREIASAADEYKLHLRAIEVKGSLDDDYLPRRLIQTIGESLAEGVYGEQFDPEPPLSFTVPSTMGEESGLRRTLTQLSHYGAIVQQSESRFRLSHMFAPIFALPLRQGRSRALEPMLNRNRNRDQLHIEDEG